ncbi:amino acid ABC transporter permease [Pseudomonas putida]|uniref:amino acid ABC transporter permease n=1 Tax=Pseudomonas putida TaxID=303 RepID=UPI0033599DE3
MEIIDRWIEWFPQLMDGYWLSLQVTAVSLLIGIPLGLLFALWVGSKKRLNRALALIFIEVGRGGPVLILLQFFYFGLPTTGLTLSSFTASILALAWSTGSYTSEIIRGGLGAVPQGQREAARTLGLSGWDALRIIILPQGLRIALPPLLGFSLVILQTTSLCFTIALPELVGVANDIGSATFEYMSVLLLTGMMYAAVCIPATIFVGRYEKHLSRYESA